MVLIDVVNHVDQFPELVLSLLILVVLFLFLNPSFMIRQFRIISLSFVLDINLDSGILENVFVFMFKSFINIFL
jgi:hypothetical protein